MEDTLRKCADFNILTNEEITDLAKIGKKETFQQGQQVFSINHEGNKFFILVDGRLTLRLKRNISKTYYKAGDLFGEVAILGDTLRFGTIIATEDTDLISIHRDDLFHSEFISKELALKITLLLSKKIISYFEDQVILSSKKMIEYGECDYIEFKSAFNRESKLGMVKTLVSFMNLNGGTVFCGVNDDKTIKGINQQIIRFDDFQKKMNDCIMQKIGPSFLQYVDFDIENIEGKEVFRLDCIASRSPVFYREVDQQGRETELFVVRSGSSNVEMKKTSRIIEYVKERFKDK